MKPKQLYSERRATLDPQLARELREAEAKAEGEEALAATRRQILAAHGWGCERQSDPQ